MQSGEIIQFSPNHVILAIYKYGLKEHINKVLLLHYSLALGSVFNQ